MAKELNQVDYEYEGMGKIKLTGSAKVRADVERVEKYKKVIITISTSTITLIIGILSSLFASSITLITSIDVITNSVFFIPIILIITSLTLVIAVVIIARNISIKQQKYRDKAVNKIREQESELMNTIERKLQLAISYGVQK